MSKEGITFKIHVQPRASKDAIAGEYNNALKITITSPPVDNKANLKCREFLAKAFDVPKSRVEIINGHKSREKTIFISGDKIKLEELLNKYFCQS